MSGESSSSQKAEKEGLLGREKGWNAVPHTFFFIVLFEITEMD